MNAIAEQSIAEGPVDPLIDQFKSRHDKIARAARIWLEQKHILLPVIQAFAVLNSHCYVDGDGDIQLSLAGDKDAFVKAWKLFRSIGIRLSPVEKGSTSLCQLHTHSSGLKVYFSFSSTVCQRVQVGTKMVETAVYETRCSGAEIDIKALEGNHEIVPLKTPDDNIPF